MVRPSWVTQTRCQPIGISDVGTYRQMMHRYTAIARLRR
jgi:hypothetical protein